ncbi:DUF2786 domain-containing protein [Actinocorallia sp. A-T 12471]|uniref:DUF2786 domain-containing protein n=1 Tax=Actinocorallia sp. A-T 12471 TaxID=3089813 RepID=UPI0029D32CFC|nr:DUF2786 domain-containing protein [Actinocorallia sp. A-T 12471]MDX6741868.1 DUF2786 domain-containing protein [Actinocorallia sp. A-T 12471]
MNEPERLIAAAKEAQFSGDMRAWDSATALLAADAAADGVLLAELRRARAEAAGRGWTEDDLRRHLTRFRSPAHAAVLDASALGASDRFEAVGRVVEVLCALARLPRLAVLTRSARPDHPALGRIRALLAKAESTGFPAEAEALVARAQALMTRHSLDRAALDAPDDAPTGVRLGVDGPYEEAKATLLHVVAEANRCRAVWHAELGFATVLGFPADLDAVELLYTSLLVQADTAMPKNGSRRAFRESFLTSFAHHIGERLLAAAEAETATETDLLPVLSRRDEEVDRAVDRLFPELTSVRSRRVRDAAGWAEGRKAAREADLG